MSVIIRLQNLPMSANASNIRRFFAGLSIPEGGVHIVGGSDGDAFIAFATDEDARKAMLLDRQTINNAPVRLFLSSKTEMQSIIDSARSSALFGVSTPLPAAQVTPQKSETMQALDVTAATLPSSFPSYRNGILPEPYRGDRSAEVYAARPSSPPRNVQGSLQNNTDPQRHNTFADSEGSRIRIQDKHQIPHEYDRRPMGFIRPDDAEDRPPGLGDYAMDSRNLEGPRNPAFNFRNEPRYDNKPHGFFEPPPRDRNVPFPDTRFAHQPPERPSEFDRDCIPRFSRPDQRESRDPRGPRDQPQNVRDHRHGSENIYEKEPQFRENERDFSVRPPWLNDNDSPGGSKRPFPGPPVSDDVYRKRRMPEPAVNSRSTELTSLGETDFIVKLTLPMEAAEIKSIFEILRGVQIVAKWGIRIEEDALHRSTGYVFIMAKTRDSFDRALACNGRVFKGKLIKVESSTLDEFYKVTDSNFHLKCPPEIAKKLPSGSSVSPPHHADGCLELAELPPDTTKNEIVRFLGAPGLSASNVTIASFPPGDKSAPSASASVRALISLPSSKDIAILLSAKPRPLRPDGAFPPVRLTAISKVQLDFYSAFSVEDKSKPVELVEKNEPPFVKSNVGDRLTCAYVSGLDKSLKEFEVLRLFPSVIVPGDAIHMIGPSNKSAFIDFISETTCRRAVADITNPNSKAKQAHPAIQIQPISRTDMEQRLSSSSNRRESSSPIIDNRPAPHRDRDPRPWDSGPQKSGAPRHSTAINSYSQDRQNRPPESYLEKKPQLYGDSFAADNYARRHHSNDLRSVDGAMPPMRMPDPSIPQRRPVPEFATVHIGNLPPTATTDQLAGVLRDYYFVPGSIRLRRDIHGMPTGEGLVDFNSTYDGDRAIRDLNGYRMAGRPLVLRYDRRP